ncbi:MAG: AAA family ATPase [Planctomycetota bacterium]
MAEGNDGRVLLTCHAQCSLEAICTALGLTVADLFPPPASRRRMGKECNSREVKAYDYCDEHGKVLFQVVRYQPKGFSQRRPDGQGGWIPNLDGVRRVVYRVPDLLAADPNAWVFIVEGEKDADRLAAAGLIATTNPGGAGKWYFVDDRPLHGRKVCLIPDNDGAGRKHTDDAGQSLHGKAADLRLVALPGLPRKGDVSDWFDAGHTAGELLLLAKQAPRFVASPTNDGASTPVVVRLADVQPQPVEWLWLDRIARGKLTLVAGDPGLGKSFLTLDFAARVSSGTPLPDRRDEPIPPAGVVLLSAEDDVADTIRPRLDAAGAEVSRINAIQGVEWRDGTTGKTSQRSFNLERDLPALEQAIQQTPDCGLVIIDPITAFLGKVDSHKNAELRGLLAPLAELAARHKVAVVAVTHLNKNEGIRALYRAMGSLGFVAAARAVWLVVPDANDPERRLFLCAKNNLAAHLPGLAYRLEPQGTAAVVAWEAEPVTVTADEALAALIRQGEERSKGKTEASADWLRGQLKDGPVPMRTIETRAQDAGMTWPSVRRAKDRLHVAALKTSFGGGWVWALPTADGDTPRPPDPEGAQNPPSPRVEHLEHLEHVREPPIHAEDDSQGVQGAQDAQPGATSGSEHLPCEVTIPPGWEPLGWAAELERKAGCCESTNPALAVEYRRQATAIRAAGVNPKQKTEST